MIFFCNCIDHFCQIVGFSLEIPFIPLISQVKDYLSRKEMHQLAKKTNLTVNQVRPPPSFLPSSL